MDHKGKHTLPCFFPSFFFTSFISICISRFPPLTFSLLSPPLHEHVQQAQCYILCKPILCCTGLKLESCHRGAILIICLLFALCCQENSQNTEGDSPSAFALEMFSLVYNKLSFPRAIRYTFTITYKRQNQLKHKQNKTKHDISKQKKQQKKHSFYFCLEYSWHNSQFYSRRERLEHSEGMSLLGHISYFYSPMLDKIWSGRVETLKRLPYKYKLKHMQLLFKQMCRLACTPSLILSFIWINLNF